MDRKTLAKQLGIPITELIDRADGRIERKCSHGVGHTIFAPRAMGKAGFVHGCDGCCSNWSAKDDTVGIKAPSKNLESPPLGKSSRKRPSIFSNPDEECIFCHGKRKYSEKYDAYYCPKCVYWLERICPDRNCEFCSVRPKYSNLKEEAKWNKENKLK